MTVATTVRKAVFPVAGLGTRFLPATKASPKEMLPVVDKPLIQYAVEEAYAAGIRHMIFVTGRSKRAIEDHFDTAYELEAELEALLAKQSEVEAVMADPETYAQRELFATLSKEYGTLSHAAEEMLARMAVLEEEISDLEARRAALLESA